MQNKINIKNGFTLAEVLITLVIVGVIASMTIPTLINKTNKQEFVSRLKKAYSTMAQATNKIIAEEGNPRADIGGWATSGEAVYDMYKKYLSNVKECGLSTSGCFDGIYKRMNGGKGDYYTDRRTFVIADGMEISIKDSDLWTDCSRNTNGTLNTCATILVDVNGAKGPNTIGQDAFAFNLREDGLVPAGADNKSHCSTSYNGWACAGKVLAEGAINY